VRAGSIAGVSSSTPNRPSKPPGCRSERCRKHKFKVVATDEAGNTDPSAAKDKFNVVE
jgi:hypothetical protein